MHGFSHSNHDHQNDMMHETYYLLNLKSLIENEKCSMDNLEDVQLLEDEACTEDVLSLETGDSPTDVLTQAFEDNLHVSNSSNTDSSITSGDALVIKEKKKRKKKRKGSTRNPNQLLAFNQHEKMKIENKKLSLDDKRDTMGKASDRNLSFSSHAQSFNCAKPITIEDGRKKGCFYENGGRSENSSPNGKDILYTRALSFPPSFRLVPAIRGGREQNGMGPRPKLSVSWAPDVHEPPSSLVSHTVKSKCHQRPRRREKKKKQKSKSSGSRGQRKTNNQKNCFSPDTDATESSCSLLHHWENSEENPQPSNVQIIKPDPDNTPSEHSEGSHRTCYYDEAF
eukprot:TRINITY_DN2303_c0_g1_i1.p1 TRINITY_DN2303_c0_g1~~TRINITY_DN2303_c0_g1_i1.p1  ORF type:complete len:339 (-),score=69.64 TRINITY_DN2303_c0_g1_i1:208-1224(-)